MTGLSLILPQQTRIERPEPISFIVPENTPYDLKPDTPLTPQIAGRLVKQIKGKFSGSDEPYEYSLDASKRYLRCSIRSRPSRTFECGNLRYGDSSRNTRLYRLQGKHVLYVFSTAECRDDIRTGELVDASGGSNDTLAARLADGFVLDVDSVKNFCNSKSESGSAAGTPPAVRFYIGHGKLGGERVTDNDLNTLWNKGWKSISDPKTPWEYNSDMPGQTSPIDNLKPQVYIKVGDGSNYPLKTEETELLREDKLQKYQQKHTKRIQKAEETIKNSFALLPEMTHYKRPKTTYHEQSVAPSHNRLGVSESQLSRQIQPESCTDANTITVATHSCDPSASTNIITHAGTEGSLLLGEYDQAGPAEAADNFVVLTQDSGDADSGANLATDAPIGSGVPRDAGESARPRRARSQARRARKMARRGGDLPAERASAQAETPVDEHASSDFLHALNGADEGRNRQSCIVAYTDEVAASGLPVQPVPGMLSSAVRAGDNVGTPDEVNSRGQCQPPQQAVPWLAQIEASIASGSLPRQQSQYVTAAGVYFRSSGEAAPLGLPSTSEPAPAAHSSTLQDGLTGTAVPWFANQDSDTAYTADILGFPSNPTQGFLEPEGISHGYGWGRGTTSPNIPVDPALEHCVHDMDPPQETLDDGYLWSLLGSDT